MGFPTHVLAKKCLGKIICNELTETAGVRDHTLHISNR